MSDQKRQVVLTYGANLAAALVCVMLGTIVAVLFIPFTPIEAVQPFRLNNPIVEAGGILSYEADYEVHTDKTFDVEWQLIDVDTPDLYAVLPIRGTFHPGMGVHHVRRDVLIPSDTPPGRYFLRVKDSVKLFHPIRPTSVVWFSTDVFTVVKK